LRRTRYQFGTVQRKKRKQGPDVWVYRYVTEGKKKSVIIGTLEKYPKKAHAVKAAEHLRSVANSDQPTRQAPTFGALIDRYEREAMPQRHSTADSYSAWIRAYIRPKWADYKIDEVQSGNVEAWLRSLPLAPKSLNNIRWIMSKLLKCAMRWNLMPLSINPMSLIEIPGGSKRKSKARVLDNEQVRAFIGNIEREPFKTMAWLAVGIGLERSTVVGLRWQDVDFEGLTVHVRTGVVDNFEGPTKNEYRAAPLPLHPALAQMLRNWKAVSIYVAPEDWVFASPYFEGKLPYSPRHVAEKQFWPAAKAAGIGDRLGWQSLRRTYASLLAKLETRVRVTQSLMRHNDPKTTQGLYQDAYSDDMQKANTAVVGGMIQ
jgi:integrase